MTSAPVTIPIDAAVSRVRQIVARDRVRWMPVMEGTKVVGVLTDRDIAFSDATPDTTAGMLMSRDVVGISPMTSLQEAARQMFECEVDGLPVIEDDKLVGAITRSDILKAFAENDAATALEAGENAAA